MDTRRFLLLAAVFLAACGGDVAVGDTDGGATAPSGSPFACATQTCQPGTLCVHQVFVGTTSPDVYTCSTFPSACEATPTCDCLAAHPGSVDLCGPGNCTEDADGHVTMSCQPP